MLSEMKPTLINNRKIQIQVITVTSLDALVPYAEQWDQLALQAPQRLPMLSSAWVMAYLEHCLNPDEKWKCYLATTLDSQLIGVLPIVIKPHSIWHSFFLTLHTPWDWHTRSGDLLAESGMERLILQAFLDTLRKDFGHRFILEMKGVRGNSPTLMALSHTIPGWVPLIRQEAPGGFIPVTGTLEQFQKKLSTKFKSNLRYSFKKLVQMPGFAITFLTQSGIDSLSLSRFFELEASGWKGKIGTAIEYSSNLKSFYYTLAKELAKRKWLEVHLLEAEQNLIAGHFAVRFGSALIIPKIAYDEAYSKFSPGSILFERIIERAFEEESCIEINMLSDAEWFNRWKMEWSIYYQISLFPKHPAPLILGKMPKILYKILSKIRWLRHFYQRFAKLFRS